MEFSYEEGRVYYANASGKLLAEVTFPSVSDQIVVIDHTFVDESLRGQGIAGKLMEAAAEKLREHKRKARPECSYAVSWFKKHPDYADILELDKL